MPKHIPKFHGVIKDGKFSPKDPKSFINHANALEGLQVTVVMTKYKPYSQRSNEQNRYYHGVVVKLLSEEIGYTSDEMHEAIKYKFLGEHRKIKKTEIVVPISTADLNTVDFESFLSEVRSWASSELSVFIPLPNEVPFEY